MTYMVQRQRTAEAYSTIAIFDTLEQATNYLREIAKENPEYPYDGELMYKVGKTSHFCIRYRIIMENENNG